MRVLHFLPVYVPAWQFGGPVLSVSRLCEGLVQEGVDIRVITTNAGLPDFPIDQLGIPQNVNGVQVFYYPVDNEVGPIRSRALVLALHQHMAWAELLHLSSIWQPLGLPVQRSAHVAGIPIVQTLRGALGPYSWRRGWWKKMPYFFLNEKPLLQTASVIHCTTIQESQEISWLGLKPSIKILPNPLDLSNLQFNPSIGREWRQLMGFSVDEPLFLVAGRLHHKKGLELLPRVLSHFTHISWKIIFIGQDDDRTELKLKRAFSRAGLAERCSWLPALPANALVGPYNAADWLLLPSRHENFGNVVVEALACGCGVLTSDKVGVVADISDCQGVFVAPRSTHLWIKLIAEAIRSVRPGIASSDYVRNYCGTAKVVHSAMQIYFQLIDDITKESPD